MGKGNDEQDSRNEINHHRRRLLQAGIATYPILSASSIFQPTEGLAAEVEGGTLVLTNQDDTTYYYHIAYQNESLSSSIAANSTENVPGFSPGEFSVTATTSWDSGSGEIVPINGKERFEFTVPERGLETATAITFGETLTESSTESTIADHWYSFEATEGETIEFVQRSAEGAIVTIYDDDEEKLASNQAWYETIAIGSVVPECGTYYLNIRGQGLPDFDYVVTGHTPGSDSFEPNNNPLDAKTIELGEQVNGSVEMREEDWFELEALAGERITAELTRQDIKVDWGNDIEIAVIAPDGSEIGDHPAVYCPDHEGPTTRTTVAPYCNGRTTATQKAVAPVDGTYYVRVSGFQNEADDLFNYSVQGFSNYSLVVSKNKAT